jgi:hypothetical protein
MSHAHSYTCSCASCRRDPDPAPADLVVTDFSEIWRLRLAEGEAGPDDAPEVDYTVGLRRTATERIEQKVDVVHGVGRHRWTESTVVVTYRTVRP